MEFKFWEQQKQSILETVLHQKTMPYWFKYRLNFLTIHGSHAYGLDLDDSDYDIAGLMIPPKEYFFGFVNQIDQFDSIEGHDGAIYNIKKFIKLAVDANPNVLELLWIDPRFWVFHDHVWEKLVQKRDYFLSKKVRYTYAGYATAQLKRIQTHKKWLLNPPAHQPTREEFGLPLKRVISADQLGAMNALVKEGNLEVTNENFMSYLQAENQYGNAKREWEQYNHWKASRNPARAELEKKFGYDTKHAMHLVRLLRQCQEILTTGKITTYRFADREELLEIRKGAWKYEELMSWAEAQDKLLDELYETSKLPRDPSRLFLDDLCVELIERATNGYLHG